MYEPRAIDDGQTPYAAGLAQIAFNRKLVIYTGAGLSRALPTDIPDGGQIARRCHARLSDSVGAEAFDGVDTSNLTAVADAAEAAAGRDLIRMTAAEVADFTSARHNLSHELLALLLLEGFVEAITTNWDDCVERAGGDERVLAIVSDTDRREVNAAALLKVHGCATRPVTLLITGGDLEEPPPWARDVVNARLADSVVVFVGIGDVAGYVRKRIDEATAAVGDAGAVFVVSPSIRDRWSESVWADVVPELSEDHRIGATSDEFLDQVAAACVRRILREISEALAEEATMSGAFESARSGLERLTARAVLRWSRSCLVPRSPGASAMRSQAFPRAMAALGSLGREAGVTFNDEGRACAGDAEYEVLVAAGLVSASDFRREAESRLVQRRSTGDRTDPPTFMLAGALGRIEQLGNLPGSVLDEIEPDDVMTGPLAVTPRFVHAEDLAS